MKTPQKLKEIISYLKMDKIPKEKILEWQKVEDDRITGFLVYILTERKYTKKVEPFLDFYDCYPFLLNGYIKCMQMYFDDDYFATSHMAGYELRNLIEHFWNYEYICEKEIVKIRKEIKDRLAHECLKADRKYADILINGLLEHLFDNRTIKNYFKDWQKHKKLKIFYECSVVKNMSIPWEELLYGKN